MKTQDLLSSYGPGSDYKYIKFGRRCCTFYSQTDLFQSSVLQHRLGHVSVLYVFEEAVQFGAVDDCWEMRGVQDINSPSSARKPSNYTIYHHLT